MHVHFSRLRALALGLVAVAAAACSSPSSDECKELSVAECATASDHAVFYADRDKDGFGTASDAKCLCHPADPYTSTAPGDTNDTDPNIKPNAEDKCDGIDNDGDGLTDEGYFLSENGQAKAIGFVPKTPFFPPAGATQLWLGFMASATRPSSARDSTSGHSAEK